MIGLAYISSNSQVTDLMTKARLRVRFWYRSTYNLILSPLLAVIFVLLSFLLDYTDFFFIYCQRVAGNVATIDLYIAVPSLLNYIENLKNSLPK